GAKLDQGLRVSFGRLTAGAVACGKIERTRRLIYGKRPPQTPANTTGRNNVESILQRSTCRVYPHYLRLYEGTVSEGGSADIDAAIKDGGRIPEENVRHWPSQRELPDNSPC